jgi:hypothetical protein
MNNPEFWLDVHQRVQRSVGYRTTTIAGGCIRDYMLGLDAKDIDVFVGHSIVRHDNLATLRHPDDFEFLGTATEEEYPGAANHFVVCNYRYMDTDIQVMHLRGDFRNHLETFDHNMCFGQFDGNRTVLPLNFMKGYARKEVEVYNDGEKTKARAETFIDKVSAVEDGWRLAPRNAPVAPAAGNPWEMPAGGVVRALDWAPFVNGLQLEPGVVNAVQGRRIDMVIIDDVHR